jgi:uncharacterized protein
MSDLAKDLSDFGGTVRLFPLPNFVMLPHVVKPFHIFEPRYKEMTQDALAGDRFITLVLLKDEKEGEEAEGLPPIAEMACLTRIVNEQKQPDGRYNLLLRGLCRVRVVKELVTPTLYRQAAAELLPDPDEETPSELRDVLADAAKLWLPPQGPAQAQFEALLGSELPLGALCDIVGFAMPLPSEIKQALLDETDIAVRAQKLVSALTATPPPLMQVESPPFRHRKYPPEFSQN